MGIWSNNYIEVKKVVYVNVRNEASFSPDTLKKIPNGIKIVKYSQKGEWYYVKFPVEEVEMLSEDYGYS